MKLPQIIITKLNRQLRKTVLRGKELISNKFTYIRIPKRSPPPNVKR